MMNKFKNKFGWKRFTFSLICVVIPLFVIVRAPQFIKDSEILDFNQNPKSYDVELQILDSNNEKVTEFLVAIADDDYKKMYGLMNLSNLPPSYGMLFPLSKNQVIMMWMRNTRIPLDMLFIDENNIIDSIEANATPYSRKIVASKKEVRKVLEINGGLAKKHGIQPGQQVKF